MIAKQLRKGVARSVSLLLVAVSIICVGSPVLAKSANGLCDSTPFDATLGEFFNIRLDFSGPPLLNETAELVLTVSPAQDVSDVAIQIVLPDEIELVKGDLGWEGDLSAHQQLQQRVVVKVVKVGSYEIQASVEGLTPDGQPVQQRKRLYVATSEKAAAVSEIPIDIPEQPVISSRPEIDVGDQIGEAELVADPEAGLVTLGDDSPKAPKVIREEGVQIEGDGEAELVAQPEAGLVTLGHDSPRAPKLIRQKGVQIEGDGEGELIADPQAGLVTLGDDSPRAPKVIREESVQIEGYGEAELVADRKAGLVTLGDDSPNPPKVTEEGDIFARGSGEAIAGNSPDLVVDDIWSTTTPLTAGEWEGIRFRERNQGTTSAGFHRIRMRVDGSALYYWDCSGLGAGRSAEGSVNLKTSTPGSHEICIDADYTNLVPEWNEGNNSRCETWSWGGTAPGGADLVVDDIWSTTTPLAVGEWETIKFRERNQGTTSAGFHRIRMRVDGSALYYWDCSSLGAGSSAVGSVNLKTSTAGNHEICIDTDYTSQVPESNEGNNTRCETWSWGGAAPGDEKILSVPAKRQEQTKWCWAGCAQMVLAYYGTNVAQCDMANFAWGRSDCCTNPSSSNCNQGNDMYGTSGSLQSILSNWGVSSTPQASSLSFNDVQSQIGSNWPLIARWGWTGGGGHFLVLRGYRISNTNVHYIDPWDGAYHTSTCTWFDNDGNHDWTHTLMNVY